MKLSYDCSKRDGSIERLCRWDNCRCKCHALTPERIVELDERESRRWDSFGEKLRNHH